MYCIYSTCHRRKKTRFCMSNTHVLGCVKNVYVDKSTGVSSGLCITFG